MSKTPLERVLERVVVTEGGCWIWTGADSGNGFGRISIDGKTRATHIVVYEAIKGPVPKGKVLNHTCVNRLCCNPEDLKPIPGVVNTLIGEGPTAINALKTECKRGHAFTTENTIVRMRGGRASRECRECKRLRALARASIP